MKIFENEIYQQDVKYVANLNLPWRKLQDKTIMISGATGQIGSFLIDVLMYRNKNNSMNCLVYALGRNKEKVNNRFAYYCEKNYYKFIQYDVKKQLLLDNIKSILTILLVTY